MITSTTTTSPTITSPTITSPIIITSSIISSITTPHKKSFKPPHSHTHLPLRFPHIHSQFLTFILKIHHFLSNFHYHNLQIINSLYYHQPSKI